jgi:hypothetical protein
MQARSEKNLPDGQIRLFLKRISDGFGPYLAPHLAQLAQERADDLREAHRRVRRVASLSVRVAVEPQLPPDVLGMYVYLPNTES